MPWSRGELVELDGMLGAIVGIYGDPGVPEDHIAVWFGSPETKRKSEGGAGGVQPEVYTVPAELCGKAAPALYKH